MKLWSKIVYPFHKLMPINEHTKNIILALVLLLVSWEYLNYFINNLLFHNCIPQTVVVCTSKKYVHISA